MKGKNSGELLRNEKARAQAAGLAILLFGAIGLLLGSCSTIGLDSLVLLDGRELHPTLRTRQLDEGAFRHVRSGVVVRNPQHSSDAEFIRAVAGSGSQGNLGGEGMSSALFALYAAENELGFYGLEAVSPADANRREEDLRRIWSHNVSLDRASVHRAGLLLVVVWTDGVSPEVWEAVNSGVAERIGAPWP